MNTHLREDTRKFVKFCYVRLSHRRDSSMNPIPSEQFDNISIQRPSREAEAYKVPQCLHGLKHEHCSLQKVAGARYGGSKSTRATFTKQHERAQPLLWPSSYGSHHSTHSVTQCSPTTPCSPTNTNLPIVRVSDGGVTQPKNHDGGKEKGQMKKNQSQEMSGGDP